MDMNTPSLEPKPKTKAQKRSAREIVDTTEMSTPDKNKRSLRLNFNQKIIDTYNSRMQDTLVSVNSFFSRLEMIVPKCPDGKLPGKAEFIQNPAEICKKAMFPAGGLPFNGTRLSFEKSADLLEIKIDWIDELDELQVKQSEIWHFITVEKENGKEKFVESAEFDLYTERQAETITTDPEVITRYDLAVEAKNAILGQNKFYGDSAKRLGTTDNAIAEATQGIFFKFPGDTDYRLNGRRLLELVKQKRNYVPFRNANGEIIEL